MKRLFLLLTVLQLLLLTACWDSNEIEDLGMIMGIGIDYHEDEEEVFALTNQYVVPNNIQGTETGTTGEQPYQNITLNGNNFFEVIRENSLETDRPPNYTHLKSMVLSEELLRKEPIKQLISFFLRDHEFRRTVSLFISREPAASILNVEPTKEMFPAVQLKELTQNKERSLYVLDNLKFGEASNSITEGASFIIPEVGIHDDRLRLLGAGIVSNKNEKLVGWLSPEEVGGFKWITDEVQGGLVTIEAGESKEDQVVLEIMKSNTTVEPNVENGKLTVDLIVESSLRLAEDWEIERDVFKEGWETPLQEKGEQVVKKDIERVLSIAQKEHQLDFLQIGTWVKIKQPRYWKEQEKNWESIFPSLTVNVDVNLTITGYGTQDIN
ncbi:Ger(x)C family spore germination protein [Pseudalkalibacillus hwajinpoensis]|uniref:Ger(x)C family spore germination protein n=1 Tax=Guptibacillus hwajinpoensis TaxID=208199 RepID=UPI00384BDDF0